MRKIEVVLSPALLGLYELSGKIVVVVDILRATSTMVAAMAHGVERILPFASLDECRAYQGRAGFLCAAERDGQKAEGFDMGNSPLAFTRGDFSGLSLAMTTTNGTEAIKAATQAQEVIIGSFLNLSAVVEYLAPRTEDVIILCAGWKGRINAEDSLFAGAVVSMLHEVGFEFESDAPMIAELMYESARMDMGRFLSRSSHVRRLANLEIEDDVAFCLNVDAYSVVPVLQEGVLVRDALAMAE